MNKLERRRALRARQTKAEQKLWCALRNRKFAGLKFRRQHSIARYIVDFCCLDWRLVVELDGGYHEETEEYDASRTRFLEGEGYRVVRFTNDDVIEDPDAVLLCLAKLLGVDWRYE